MIYLQKKKKKPSRTFDSFYFREKKKPRTWDAPSQTHKPYTKIKDISSLFQSYCTNDVGPHFPERSHDPPTTVGSSLETRVSHTAQRSTQKIKHVERIWSKFLPKKIWLKFLAHLISIYKYSYTHFFHRSHKKLPQVYSHIPPNIQSTKPSLSLSLSLSQT